VEINLDIQILYAWLGVLILITVNAALKVLRAIVAKEFDAEVLPDYLRKHILPDGGALLLVGAAALAVPEAAPLFWLGVAAAMAKYTKKIKDALAKKGLTKDKE